MGVACAMCGRIISDGGPAHVVEGRVICDTCNGPAVIPYARPATTAPVPKWVPLSRRGLWGVVVVQLAAMGGGLLIIGVPQYLWGSVERPCNPGRGAAARGGGPGGKAFEAPDIDPFCFDRLRSCYAAFLGLLTNSRED
jgi:hypothetical protein